MIVQKYGGSSLSCPEKILKVAERIKYDLSSHGKMVVVVSAMGDTTDYLLDLAELVCEKPLSREVDVLLSTGEQISASLLAMALGTKGICARSFNAFQLGIITDDHHGNARIISIDKGEIEESFKDNDVLVVTGFQGVNSLGDITTLGRGGSDTTAVAIASCCNCPCEIYSDVAGIYTCDPGLIPGAKKLEFITYDHMLILAMAGAEVLNPVAVEKAKNDGVPLYCGSTFSDEKGTRVVDSFPDEMELQDVIGIATEIVDGKLFHAKVGADYPEFSLSNSFFSGPLTRITAVANRRDHEALGNHVLLSLKMAGIRLFEASVNPGNFSALISTEDRKRSVEVLALEFGLLR